MEDKTLKEGFNCFVVLQTVKMVFLFLSLAKNKTSEKGFKGWEEKLQVANASEPSACSHSKDK